jgi:hypothetical protein
MSKSGIFRNLLKHLQLGSVLKVSPLNYYDAESKLTRGVEADNVECNFRASVASAYRLSTSKITLSDINNDIPGLDQLLKHKRKRRKSWQETRDPACKTAVNGMTKSIRRMTRKKGT